MIQPIPRQLCAQEGHQWYDKVALLQVDKVFVDGVSVSPCFAYNMDEGWAIPRLKGYNGARVYGVVTVTLHRGSK
jgi:hypothetical protein